MARIANRSPCPRRLDERGAVYVEFLIVFIPVFLLFLGICQIALIGAARLVVQHAANSAVRSAVVVLESSPGDFENVERGWVSCGSARGSQLPESLLRSFGFDVPSSEVDIFGDDARSCGASSSVQRPQQGARMAPIRFAAYTPLAVLAPPPAWLKPRRPEGSLADALSVSTRTRLSEAVQYNRGGAVVTLQVGPGLDELASEPIGSKAAVTVRVTYLYYCSIPVVRGLACRSLSALIGEISSTSDGSPLLGKSPVTLAQRRLAAVLALAEEPKLLARLDAAGARFAVLSAESTLPNQGAAYY